MEPDIRIDLQLLCVIIAQTIRPLPYHSTFNISLLNVFDFSPFFGEFHDFFTTFVVLFSFHRVTDRLICIVVIEVVAKTNIPSNRIKEFLLDLISLVSHKPGAKLGFFNMRMLSSFRSRRSLAALSRSSNYIPAALSDKPLFRCWILPKMSPMNNC